MRCCTAWVFASLALGLALASMGCASGPVAPEPLVDDSRVLVSRDLRGVLEISARPDWTDDRRLAAFVQVRNTSNDTLLLYVTTYFKDAGGRILNDGAVADAVIVNAHGDYAYSKAALREEARDFSIRIRKGESY